jgi:hypothetical protein
VWVLAKARTVFLLDRVAPQLLGNIVCVAFPALSAIEEGFEVFVVTDASGTFNEVTRHAAWLRMEAAGAQLMS